MVNKSLKFSNTYAYTYAYCIYIYIYRYGTCCVYAMRVIVDISFRCLLGFSKFPAREARGVFYGFQRPNLSFSAGIAHVSLGQTVIRYLIILYGRKRLYFCSHSRTKKKKKKEGKKKKKTPNNRRTRAAHIITTIHLLHIQLLTNV